MVLLVIAIFVLLIWLGPGLLALLLGISEFLLVLLGAVAVFIGRTVARRPWAVVATDGEIAYSWSVVGYRRARALVRSASRSIEAGLGLAGIDPMIDAGIARQSRAGGDDRKPH